MFEGKTHRRSLKHWLTLGWVEANAQSRRPRISQDMVLGICTKSAR
jgi:hypothetical protein